MGSNRTSRAAWAEIAVVILIVCAALDLATVLELIPGPAPLALVGQLLDIRGWTRVGWFVANVVLVIGLVLYRVWTKD
jgi:hypothetical protein